MLFEACLPCKLLSWCKNSLLHLYILSSVVAGGEHVADPLATLASAAVSATPNTGVDSSPSTNGVKAEKPEPKPVSSSYNTLRPKKLMCFGSHPK